MNIRTKNMIILFILLVMTGISNLAQAAVWTDQNVWSDAWEVKYKEWLQTATHADFFANQKLADGRPNPYYGIRVDCADLVYSLRIIFAFEQKLSFAISNPVNPKGPLITNQIKRFDSLPEGHARLKGFLTWLFDVVSTSSIPQDTYSIGFADVGPGSIILTSKKNHHSWTIQTISKAGNPTLIYNSTVERESGFDVQVRHSWPNPSWIFEPTVDENNPTVSIPVYKTGSYAGFRYWRPAAYLNKPEATVPRYSEEQFLVGLNRWKGAAIKHLAQVQESIDQVVLRLVNDACADLKQRSAAVREAETYKDNLANALAEGNPTNPYVSEILNDPNAPSDHRCMTFKKFDQFSTPSRDRRFVDALMLARAYYQLGLSKSGEGAFKAENLKIFKTIFPFISKSAKEEAALDTAPKAPTEYCSVYISSKVGSISLAEAKRRLFNGQFSANPNDYYSARFGFEPTKRDLGKVCPTFDLGPSSFDLNKSEAEALKEAESSL